ncbi:cupin domain-containing protein [Lysobacter cavernae]|uniref:Cupin domain-containing protein n=1 Tax=Lysobacter cavernae TaxID=1685901 RepID=A0ABV7RRX1_9GAMM
MPGGCQPLGLQRSGEVGCFIIASQPLGRVSLSPLYWHIDAFATPHAARLAMSSSSTVVEAFDRVWLMTIAAPDWRARDGARIARIGPLPRGSAQDYTATYMETTFAPGMQSRVHWHPGPEAWWVLEGAQCLETPEGRMEAKAGEGMLVHGDLPMVLHGVGAQRRRSLVLVLHDSAEAPVQPERQWLPKGLCG